MISKAFFYFRRGHYTYVSLLIGLLNFFTIQYTLLVRDNPDMLPVFLGLIVLYPVVCVLMGIFDQRHTIKVDSTMLSMQSPYSKDMARALVLLAEGKNDEVREVLKKW